MRSVLFGVAAACLLAGVARAADKPVIGPAPGWVRPVAWVAPADGSAEAAVRILLADQQIDLERGRQTVYSEVAFKIQTPQGLSAGNISFPWRPDRDILTVHKLLISRGDKTIDVLASGQTFTVVRREQNLENAVLDGVLTANIQPEGLQVGDTLDFAASVTSSDPTLKGHVEQLDAAWNGTPIDRAHLRVQWPASLPVRLRAAGRLPAPTLERAGGLMAAELSLDHLEPIQPPKGAPPRYGVGRVVEMTDYASWGDVGALMAPYYDKAAVIAGQGSLRTELEHIEGLSPDPNMRTQAALALVQDRVRYVALAMGAGGYVPADAETTWSRRFGDCKGKTVLLLALLHAMGIQSEPVAVSTMFGDGLDGRLPLIGLLNHVLVRAQIGDRTYWLDGTRTDDTSLDRLTVPNYGWGVVLSSQRASLVRLLPAPLALPSNDISIRIDATAGIAAPAPTEVELVLRGDEAISLNASMANEVGEQRESALKQFWKNQYDFIDPTTVEASFDPKTGEARLTMQGSAKLDWAGGSYQTDGTDVGYRADFSRDPGPNADAPFAVQYPYFTRTRETIRLPKGFEAVKLGSAMAVDQTAGGIEYKRHASIVGNLFSIEKTERSLTPEFPAKAAPAEQAALRMLADRHATLSMPSDYAYTGKDIAAVRADTPTTSAGFVNRAMIFVDRDLRGEALKDYDKAVELDPQNVDAWANRAVTRIQVGDIAGARSDLAKAEALDPQFNEIFIGRGMLADVEGHPKDAVSAYTHALQREPDNAYSIDHRAAAYARLGDIDHALADLGTSVRTHPDDPGPYIDRGNFLLGHSRFDDALADFDHAALLDPSDEWALADAGLTRVYKRQYDLATKDLDAAFKIDPKNAVIFRARGLMAEQKGTLEEAVAAYHTSLDLEPDNISALGELALAEASTGRNDDALQHSADALKRNPAWVQLYLMRANIYRNQGKSQEALREAAAVEAAASNDTMAHVVAANLYSAFHKDAEAMAAYDRALAIRPEAYIYLNRAERRPKWDRAGRQADLAAALKLQPSIPEGLVMKAKFQAEDGDYNGAVETYSSALSKEPGDPSLMTARGIAYAHAGDTSHATQDFVAARAKTTKPQALNTLCWSKATAGVGLDSALADCDAALALAPDVANYLDSRALVLLRLGRIDEAIADYDRALAKNPRLSSSLYGRAVAWAHKGAIAKSRADADAALQIDPDIGAAYEGYGMKL